VKDIQALQQARQEVEALRNSNSYRITYPLRFAATLARDAYAVFVGKQSAHDKRQQVARNR